MAEISETATPTSPPSSANPSSSSSSSEIRSSKPGTKRLIIALTVLFSFVSCLPFLLKSTEIYRSPLPFSSISSLSSLLSSRPPSSPSLFHAVFISSSPPPSSSPHSLSSSISRFLPPTSPSSVSVSFDSGGRCESGGGGGGGFFWKCGALDGIRFDGNVDDDAIDELLASRIGGGGSDARVYTVVVAGTEEAEEGVRVVVGKHRHAWIVGRLSEEDAVALIGEIFSKLFTNGGRGEDGNGLEGEFMPVGLDGTIVLSFSLLNADPNDWVYDWEMNKIDKLVLAPVVEALSPIANISIESQVLYHTPKSSISSWDDKLGSYVFGTRDLPFFVNSYEWHLDTSIAAAGRSKVLQFVVYVPSAHECPLLMRLPNGDTSKTNGFISPMWGGIVVWNPPNCSGDSQILQVKRNTIPPEEMQKIFQVFVGQLRLLLGFTSDYSHVLEGCRSSFLHSKRGFTEWELDVLYRRHACSNLLSCASTLESLSKLVQSLPRMIVTDEIGKQVKFSLEAAELSLQNASLGVYDSSAVSSRKARALAEDAFFHPSIMSISYSSIEHYFAIYMPFFAPVSLHVLLAAIKEIKRYRKEKAKYLSFVACQTAAS